MSVESKLSQLSLNLKNVQAQTSSGTSLKNQPDSTPESWDQDATDDTIVEAPGPSLKQITSNDSPGPPPPTPISPQNADPFARKWDSKAVTDGGKPTLRYASTDRTDGEKRPEKTTSTANRMIAGALGLKAPKKTEEQKQYDKALKDTEIKRKNREKEQREKEKLEDEKAKAAVWEG